MTSNSAAVDLPDWPSIRSWLEVRVDSNLSLYSAGSSAPESPITSRTIESSTPSEPRSAAISDDVIPRLNAVELENKESDSLDEDDQDYCVDSDEFSGDILSQLDAALDHDDDFLFSEHLSNTGRQFFSARPAKIDLSVDTTLSRPGLAVLPSPGFKVIKSLSTSSMPNPQLANLPLIRTSTLNHGTTLQSPRLIFAPPPITPVDISGFLKSLEKISTESLQPSSVDESTPVLNLPPSVIFSAESWNDVVPYELESILDREEMIRQNIIFEIIIGERNFVRDLQALITAFGDTENEVVTPDGQAASGPKTFGMVLMGNTSSLLIIHTSFFNRLRERQLDDFVLPGIGDLLLEWVKAVGQPYITYSENLYLATRLMQSERKHNPAFDNFLKEFTLSYPRVSSVSVMERLLRYPLLLQRLIDHSKHKPNECEQLQQAHDLLTRLCVCFERIYDQSARLSILTELKENIIWAPGIKPISLDLLSPRRSIIMRGSLRMKLANGIRKLCHVVLLDHYCLILLKEKVDYRSLYTTVIAPIPIDRLGLRLGDEKSTRSSFSFLTRTDTVTSVGSDNLLPFSESAMRASAKNDNEGDYRFQIRYLGRSDIFLYASGSILRALWYKRILSAKENYISRRDASLSIPPIKLQVCSTLFTYQRGVGPEMIGITPGSEVDLILSDIPEQSLAPEGYVGADFPAHIYCAISIELSALRSGLSRTVSASPRVTLIGCDCGLYKLSDIDSECTLILPVTKVRKIEVLYDRAQLLIMSHRSLIVYDLFAVLAGSSFSPQASSNMRARPQSFIRKLKSSSSKTAEENLSGNIVVTGLISFSLGIFDGKQVIIALHKDGSAKKATAHGSQYFTTHFRLYELVFSDSGAVLALGSRWFYHDTPLCKVTLMDSQAILHTETGLVSLKITEPWITTEHPAVSVGVGSVDRKKLTLAPEVAFRSIYKVGGAILRSSSSGVVLSDTDLKSYHVVMEIADPVLNLTMLSEDLIVICYIDFAVIFSISQLCPVKEIEGSDLRLLTSQHSVLGPDSQSKDLLFCMAHPMVKGHQLVFRVFLDK
ncbi:uncharacterized protein V1516DRAFT_700738 [Lipomyces oligophaga]|uniref:uncharacterized protein n=1 Tax=Lipomyces oligophaga TaxID=45792 RepID=UPI0034CD0E73